MAKAWRRRKEEREGGRREDSRGRLTCVGVRIQAFGIRKVCLSRSPMNVNGDRAVRHSVETWGEGITGRQLAGAEALGWEPALCAQG